MQYYDGPFPTVRFAEEFAVHFAADLCCDLPDHVYIIVRYFLWGVFFVLRVLAPDSSCVFISIFFPLPFPLFCAIKLA